MLNIKFKRVALSEKTKRKVIKEGFTIGFNYSEDILFLKLSGVDGKLYDSL